MSGKLEARHRPSGENSRFMGAGKAFDDYVRHTVAMLRRVHNKLGTADLDKVVSGNAPFELYPENAECGSGGKPYRRGVLLTHGLSDSPYFMRYLAAFFQRNGFRVMVPLLPGHGTQPGDLLQVRWQEWSKTVAYGADCLAAEVDELYLAGYSAGAALSLLQSTHDARVRGLFMFSPALAISRRARWANLHRGYSWWLPRAAWVTIMPDRDIYKYESFCKNAAAQMSALTRALPDRGSDIPVFVAASADDATVKVEATWHFMRHARHAASKLLLYTSDMGNPPPEVPSQKLELVCSVVPGQRILSFAHTSVVLPPEEGHYGEQGDYANALHYFPNEMEKYAVSVHRHGEVLLGEVTSSNLQQGVLRRLMYNPHYKQMEASMQQFIEALK